MTSYTNLLASNIVKLGYSSLTYNHIFTKNDEIVTECKVGKTLNGPWFTGMGYADNITRSSEDASKIVYKLISSDNNSNKANTYDNFEQTIVLITGLNPEYSRETVSKWFRQYGKVLNIEKLVNSMRITMDNIENAKLAIDYIKHNLVDSDVDIELLTNESKILCFSGFSSRVTVYDLDNLCSDFGTVEYVTIHNNKAIVIMDSIKSAKAVINNLNNRELDGKRLKIIMINNNTENKLLRPHKFDKDSKNMKINVQFNLDEPLLPPRKHEVRLTKEQLDEELDEYMKGR